MNGIVDILSLDREGEPLIESPLKQAILKDTHELPS